MPTITENLLDTIKAMGTSNIPNVLSYRYQRALAEARWEDPAHPRIGADLGAALLKKLQNDSPTWPQKWTAPGQVRYITPHERGATLVTDHSSIHITFFGADLVQVRYIPHKDPPPEPIPYAIATPLEEWSLPSLVTIQTDEALLLQSSALIVGITLNSGQVFFADVDGNLLHTDIDCGWNSGGAVRHRSTIMEGEHIFGLGERATPWTRQNRSHILWNTDPAGYSNGDDPIDMNIPVYIGLHDKGSYLIFYENPHYAEFDLGHSSPNVAEHRFHGGELRYYFSAGPVPQLVERYTDLTGRHTLPPLWMLGYQQCRWSYFPEERVRQLAEDFRTHQVPCDAIYLDIHYMDGYRVFTWDKDRFPDLPQLARDLREQGIKLITIIDPGIKRDPQYSVYQSGKQGQHFCTLPNGQIAHAPVWPGVSAFPDFSAPKTRAWWGELYRPLVEAGIAGFWNDMNEPAAFASAGDKTLPSATRHNLEGRGGDHREAHNLYGMLMARASQEGLRELQPESRPIVITRAGWAGVQRYATSWTGDNESTWDSLKLSVPMMMSLGLSGVSFSGPDIGGFAGDADGELFTRWIQMAAFFPLFRAHTALGTADQEPWSYGEPYLSIVRRFIELRYELLPYLYTATWQMVTRGWPMVRPLWWTDQNNADLWAIDDTFLCGDALAVAPIGEPGATSRKVTLPQGTWYEFWTNRVRQGGEPFEQFASLETIPLFVRAGAVLTLGEIGSSVETRKDKFLRLSLYPLKEPGEAASELYEDAGEGMDYQAGQSRHSRLIMQRRGNKITLTWEKHGDYQPPYEHIELTLNGLKRKPQAIRADGEEFAVLLSDAVRYTSIAGVPKFDVLEIDL